MQLRKYHNYNARESNGKICYVQTIPLLSRALLNVFFQNQIKIVCLIFLYI